MIELRGQRGLLGWCMPMLLGLSIVVASLLPLGGDGIGLTLGPHFLFSIIYLCAMGPSARLPAAGVFALGLLLDLFSAGPIGFWALVCLIAQALSFLIARVLASRRAVLRWTGFCAVDAAVSGFAWALASLYFGAWISPVGLATGAMAACIAFPAIAWMAERLQGTVRSRAVAKGL